MTSQTETPATDGKQQPARTGLMRPRMPAFPDFFSEMDRLWDTFPAAPWRIGRGRLMPAMDVYEKEGKLHVQAELPGLKAEDIEIEVTDEGLTISDQQLMYALANISARQKKPVKKFMAEAQKNGLVERVRDDLLLESALQFLKDNAQVEETDPEPEHCDEHSPKAA